jgi:hypothetical protein
MKGSGTVAHGLFIDEPFRLIGVICAPFAALNGAGRALLSAYCGGLSSAIRKA